MIRSVLAMACILFSKINMLFTKDLLPTVESFGKYEFVLKMLTS